MNICHSIERCYGGFIVTTWEHFSEKRHVFQNWADVLRFLCEQAKEPAWAEIVKTVTP